MPNYNPCFTALLKARLQLYPSYPSFRLVLLSQDHVPFSSQFPKRECDATLVQLPSENIIPFARDLLHVEALMGLCAWLCWPAAALDCSACLSMPVTALHAIHWQRQLNHSHSKHGAFGFYSNLASRPSKSRFIVSKSCFLIAP